MPPREDRPDPSSHRLELIGMAGGTGFVVLGLVFWAAAGGVQDDIDKAPTTTSQNLAALHDLESKGDAYASVGNLLAISGLVVGGIATYFYIQDRRSASTTTQARITPALFAHGAGLVLTIGGVP